MVDPVKEKMIYMILINYLTHTLFNTLRMTHKLVKRFIFFRCETNNQ